MIWTLTALFCSGDEHHVSGAFNPHQRRTFSSQPTDNIINRLYTDLPKQAKVHIGTRELSSLPPRNMSHCHDEHVGHGGHDHHDHEHDHSDDITPALQSSLYQQINFDEITTLNESRRDAGKSIVKKTWAERLSTEPELESDADEQLLMTVPYVSNLHNLVHHYLDFMPPKTYII